jgi:hypothetical protein
MGYYDDWREWLANKVFRLWRHMRPLVRSASSARMASMYSISGFVLAIVAIPIALIAWPAVFLAGVGMFAGFGYAMDGYVKRFSMRVAPGHDSRIHARDFYNPPVAPDGGYRLVTPTEASQAQLYPYTDLSDHSLFIQAENDLTRDQRASLYERWYTLCPAGFMHLEVREGDHWRPIAVSIMLPLSGAGFKAITARDKRRLSVVDLDESGIRRTLDRAHPFLLIDTWIVDREGGFGGAGHGKSGSRGGNANLLVLRHLTQFWNSARRSAHLTLLVETANPRLIPALQMLSFRKSGTSNIGEDFYMTSIDQVDAVARAEFAKIKAALKQIESAPVHAGTAPVPPNWYYKGWGVS